MKENSNIDFLSLLQDEGFIGLVNSCTHQDELYLKLTERFGKVIPELADAADFIKLTKADREKMDAAEIEQMWRVILAKSKVRNQARQKLIILWRRISVAAAVVFIVATTAFLYFAQENNTLQQFADKQAITGDHAVVVLSDGTKHQLGANDMHIEYSPDGSAIALKNNESEVEKLTNLKDVKKPLVNQVIVPFGQTHKVTLCDGTQVHLNSGSSLVFPAEFSGKTREVFLRGEGYFDVSKVSNKAFIVQTDYLDIKVLGTKFNVSAYADEHFASTILENGSVVVTRKDKMIGNVQHALQPGQGCFYSVENKQSLVQEVDVNLYIAWINGVFQFEEQPLSDVVRRIKKYYNQTIHIEGNQLAQTLVSGKLVLNNDMEQVMTYLAKALGAKYRKLEDNSYTISMN